MEISNIVLIGAGNLATNLAISLKNHGFNILQIYSRTTESARKLANRIGCDFTVSIETLNNDADMYIVSVVDNALPDLISHIPDKYKHAVFCHTAGSISIDVFSAHHFDKYGVLYPMQTFNKERIVDFENIPFFIESINEESDNALNQVAQTLSNRVYSVSTDARKILHIAAVFACNFSNHMYNISEYLLNKYNIPFDVMLPLIDETSAKIHYMSPKQAQTGPAARRDYKVIKEHIYILEKEKSIMDIYKLISDDIINGSNKL